MFVACLEGELNMLGGKVWEVETSPLPHSYHCVNEVGLSDPLTVDYAPVPEVSVWLGVVWGLVLLWGISMVSVGSRK